MSAAKGPALDALLIGGGSALLFLVQPMLAKAILPRFGGSAGVWVASMLFFQVVLLAGYFYAWCLTRFLSAKAQAGLHLTLLLASLLFLPLRVSASSNVGMPAMAILLLLGASVGLPYFLLASNSPLQQSWRVASTFGGGFPYKLFALSNAASLAALLAYPVLIEPWLPLGAQLRYWSVGYVLFAVGCSLTALRRGAVPEAPRDAVERLPAHAWLWVSLSACASAVWLAVANYLSQEVAAIPFLWVFPLGLYLLTFVLCFEGRGWYRPTLFRWLLPLAWVAIGYRLAAPGDAGSLPLEIAVFLGALFVCCMFCHGELARAKPEPRHGLEYFYLMIALGGALGAVFVALAAPNLFRTFLELPAAVVACALLALHRLFGYAPRRLVRTALIAAAALLALGRFRVVGQDVVHARNFYGVMQVSDLGSGEEAVRCEYNGRTLHGMQFLSPARRRLATAFYGAESGAGLVLGSPRIAHRRVGVVGLGVGTLALYGHAADRFRFYDINPAVVDAARRQFSFLADSPAAVEVVLADGRLGLDREPAASFDVIVLDAFSDDSIPLHLLTREAFELYFQRLEAGGTLAIHVTNRYLQLLPVVQTLAGALHREAVWVHNAGDAALRIEAADWVVVSSDRQTLAELAPFAGKLPPPPPRRVWTDEYSNLFQALR